MNIEDIATSYGQTTLTIKDVKKAAKCYKAKYDQLCMQRQSIQRKYAYENHLGTPSFFNSKKQTKEQAYKYLLKMLTYHNYRANFKISNPEWDAIDKQIIQLYSYMRRFMDLLYTFDKSSKVFLSRQDIGLIMDWFVIAQENEKNKKEQKYVEDYII